MQNNFDFLDRDRDGVVSATDILVVLQGVGVQVAESDADMLVDNVLLMTGAAMETSGRSGLRGLSSSCLSSFLGLISEAS